MRQQTRSLLSAFCFSFIVSVLLSMVSTDADAAQIKRVIRGTASFDTDDTSQSIDLGTSVILSKSIVLIDWPAATNSGLGTDRDQNNFFAAQFEDGSAIFIDRAGGTTDAAVSWQVIEFEDGVSVQRGISSMANASACPTGCTKTIDITTLTDYTKAVPIVYSKGLFAQNANDNEMSDLFYIVPTIPSNVQLTLTRSRNNSSSRTVQITWQILEFLNDAVVQTGTLAIPVNQGNDTLNTTPTSTASSVSLSGTGQNAMLFFNIGTGTSEGGMDSRFFVRGRIKDDDELEFSRRYGPNNANTGVTIRYYVVDFKEYPTTSISSSTNANPSVVNTATAHGFKTGDVVKIINHATNTAINGSTRTITVVDTDTFTVNGVTGNGNGVATGHVMMASDSLGFGDTDTAVTGLHTAVAAMDSATNTYSDISNTIDNSTPVRVTVAAAHGWADQSRIRISGYTSITALNGAWTIRTGANCSGGACSTSQFELVGSTDPGGAAGGAITNCVGLEELIYFAVTSSTDATPIVVTKNSHGLRNGELVEIWGHTTNTTANGIWVVQNVATNTFELKNAVGAGAGAGAAGTMIVGVQSTVTSTTTARTPLYLSVAGLATTSTSVTDLHNFGLTQSLVDATTLSTLRHYSARNLAALSFNYQLYEYPPLSMTLPTTGTEVWVVEDIMDITWKSSLDVAGHAWQLQYSTDGGSNWNNFGSVCGAGGNAACTGATLSTNTVKVKVPDTIGINVKFRVYDTTDTLADVTLSDQRRQSDASNKPFKIRGSILNVVTEPAAETPSNFWGFGDSGREIRWNQTGTIGTIRIDVDYNGDGLFNASDNNFGGDTAMDGYPRATGVNGSVVSGTLYKYNWNNAWDVTSSTLKVKVSADTDAAGTGLVTATSSAFEIRPTVVLTAPVDTDQWNRGLTKNITWTATGNVAAVDIYLSYNNGSTYPTTLASNVGLCGTAPCYTYATGTYTYAWPIGAAETLSTGAKIKVVQAGQSPTSYTIGDTTPDAGDSAFDIIASITLTNPISAQNPPWRVAQNETIEWTIGGGSGVTTMDVFYTTNCTGTNCTDPATTWTNQADDLTAADLSYLWNNLPATLKGASTGIAVVGNNPDAVFNTVVDKIYDMKGPFSTKAKIVLNAPGPTWRVGSNQTISWTSYGSPAALTVDWGTSGPGGPWPNNISGAGATSVAWNNIPDTAISSNVSIKVYEAGDSNLTTGVAAASAAFSVKPNITNVVLNSGCPGACTPATLFSVGDTLRVTWTVAPAALSDTVDIKLDIASGTGGFPYTVATATASAGYADWVIPNNSNYVKTTDRIRVVSQVDSGVTADSGNGTSDFQIKGSLLITNPTGPWKIGSTQSIDFTSNGVSTVNILYAFDGTTFNDPGNFTKTVITNLAASDGPNSYSWNPIPNDALDIAASSIYNDIKTTIRFRVIDANNPATYATTTADLTMRKQYLSVSVPATIYVDDVANISWVTKGNTDVTHPVKLFYDTASGVGGYPNLIPSSGIALSDSAGYSWTVPDAIGGTKRIQIKSSTDPTTVLDAMTTDFTVRGKIDQLVPTASSIVYDYNSPITISWYNHGTLGAMTIKMASDGTNFTTTLKSLATSTNNGVNSWTWQSGETGFPPAVGSTYKIKVEQDSDASNVFTSSGNNFRVKGVLALTTANSDGLWSNAGLSKNITWTKSPSTYADNQIRLYYSTSAAITDDLAGCGHASWVVIPPNPNTTAGSPATWNWASVPSAAISNTFRLKIQDGTDCTQSYDISDATGAIIRGSITSVTTAGSPWLIGTTQNIGWTSTPSAQGDVLVELSLNGGAYQPVTGVAGTSTVASQTSPFAWTIQESVLPNDYEANATVRVKLISDPGNVVSESAAFTLKKRYISVAVPAATLVVGEDRDITWDTQGNTGGGNQVVLAYDTVGGSGGFSNTISVNDGTPSTDDQNYSWRVPDAIGNNVVVRVKSSAFPSDVTGDSGVFSIKGKVTPDSNQGTATLVVGQAATINFAKTGTLGNLKIEYIHNGLSTIISPDPAGASGAASYNWSAVLAADSGTNSVIDIGGTKNSTFKFTGITHMGGALEATATSAAFQIRGDVHSMQLDTSATEGQVVYIAGSHLIRWKNRGDLGNVRIRMDRDGSGNFSDVLTGPDATYANAESIPYNYDGDGAGTDCGSTDSDYHCWEWTVPDASSNAARIRVESLDNPFSHTDAAMRTYTSTSVVTPFRIRGTYSSVSPTTAVKWKVSSNNSIDWTPSAAGMGNVNIILRYDSDANGSIDASSTLATNNATKPYSWNNLPAGFVTEKAVIRVQQTSDGTNTVFGESAEFKIKPKLQILLPNSNADQWVVGNQYDITWAAPLGSAPSFKVNISTDGGTTWNDGAVTSANKGGEIASTAPSAALEFSDWTVPDIMTNQGMIRIRKAGDSDIEATDDSDAFFYVKGSVSNVHIKNAVLDADPSVPIDLPITTTKYVTWNYTGSLGTVDLSYTTDANVGSPTYSPVPGGSGVSVGTGGSGSFAWTIPNAPSAYVRVRVTSTTNANWQSVSGVSFASAGPTYNSIIGSITAVNVVSDGNGTDAVVGANPKTILWTPNGAMLTYDIFYRINGGSWVEIANNVAGSVSGSDRTWSWAVIPDTISSNVQYRVVDHDNPVKTLFDSVDTYKIRGSISLGAPDGSQTLTVGTSYNITWTKTGAIGNIKIEMSTDDFASDIRTISGSYASTSSPYAWTPSATVSPVINNADMNDDIVKIRLTSLGGIPVSDTSTDGNTIIGTITAVQPSGSGNVWLKGESRNITWSQIGNMDAVDIFYRVSGGVAPYDIQIVSNHTGHTNGANSYTWNPVHNVNSEDVWIQVKDHNNPSTVFANSAAAFSIRPTLTVTAPVAADRLVVGANMPNLIKWTTDGTVGGGGGTVKIVYDSGSGYTEPGNIIADNVPVGNGTAGVTWNPIPDAVSSTVKIKVIDKSNANVFDESDVFKIKGSIAVSSPQGGLHWVAADTGKTVTWSKTGTLPALDVEYNLAGGVGGWTSIGQAGIGNATINWTPLPTTATNQARVRVKADYVDDDLDITSSGTDFFIENSFSGLAPTNGAVVNVGDTLPHITWNVGSATGISAVKIEFSNNQSAGTPTWTTVTDTAPNTGDFAWTYPGALANLSNDCRFKITQWNPQNGNTEFLATGSAFSIKPAITITEPVADASWGVNTNHDIKFTKRGAIQTVNIYYAPDGSTYNPTPVNAAPIDVSALADDTVYTYDWLIDANTALTAGYAGKIKIKINTPGTQTTVEKILAAGVELEVKGTVTLNTPMAAGITLFVGDTYNDITWTKFGAITNVDLHYSVDSGSTYPNLIVDNVASTPSVYPWTVPNTIDSDIKVRVRDHNNTNVVNTPSANTLRILGKVNITTPDLAGITWVVGQTNKAINWTSTGTYPTVEIDLARDGNFANTGNYGATSDPNITNIGTFANCTPVDPAITCNGTANWATVADVITGAAKIRVRDAAFPSDVTDQSTNAFKIVGSFTSITSPTVAAVWNYPDTAKEIRWTANGTITNVKIEYKTSAGGSYTTIAANDGGHTSGNNTYVWAAGLPDVNTEDAYVKVSDMTVAGSTASIELGPFSIRPTITVTSPIVSDRLVVGDTTQSNIIKWTRTGTTIATVKVLYDSGAGFLDPANLIADNVPVANGTAGIAWNPIPNAISSDVKIRVIDKDNTNVQDDSASFKIKGSLTISNPTGGVSWTVGDVSKSVSWTKTGTLPVIAVAYNLDGSNTWIDIGTTALITDTSLAWNPLPTTATNTGRVRVLADYADADLDVITIGTNFSLGNTFSNLLPTNGSVVKVGDTLPHITWGVGSATGISAVKIEYSNNQSAGSPTWTTITDTAPNTGDFAWTYPGTVNDLSNDIRLKITQWNPQNTATEFVATGSAFSIQPTITITEPVADASWGVNTNHDIKFTKRGAIQTVNIYYAPDGVTYNPTPVNAAPINVSALADDTVYTYDWLIDANTALTAGYAGKIKVKVNTPGTQTVVEKVLAAGVELEVKGTLTLNTPTAAGITLYVGDTYNDITWTKFGAITNVDLHYSVNGGSSYTNLIVGNIASTPSLYGWTVPNTIDSDIRVRVRDSNNNNVLAASGNNFRILGKADVTVPDLAGITWIVGQTNKAINWTSTGTYAAVEIDLARDGNFANTGNYGATSDPNITNIGTFANCTPVDPAITCNGTTNWATVADLITGTAKIRVRDAGFPNDVQNESANTFKIIGSFTSMASPAVAEVWNYPSTTKQIRWAANGSITNVKIEYKTSAGGAYTTIVANDGGHTGGNNTYTWAAGLPDVNTDDAYIKVSDVTVAGSTAFIEQGPFSIRPSITVSEPTIGQQLVVGTNYPNLIKWSRTGTTISTVKVLYDSGAGFLDPANVIADNVPVADGIAGIDWNIPASVTMTTTAKIRVIDKDNINVYDDSAEFVLKGGLTLTAPTGNLTTLIAGSTTNAVTWTYKGDFTVEVRYDPNSGLGADGLSGSPATDADNYPTLIGTKAAPGNNSGANSINWDLSTATGTSTTTVSNNGRVKIFDIANPTDVLSVSAANFNVGGQFDVLTPENGAVAYAEDPFLITWTPVAGTGISDVKIEYSNNSEAPSPTWIEIDSGTVKANSGSYNWPSVPGAVSDLANTNRVQVSQKSPLNAATVNVGSGSPFSIKPTLEVTSPGSSGNETLGVGTPYPIKLKKKGAVQSVDLYYSYDGTAPNYVKINGAAVDVSGAADGNGEYTYNWTPLELHTLTAGGFPAKIKAKVVTPTTQVAVEDVQSNGTKLTGSLILNTPSGVIAPLEVSDTYAITWTKFSVSNIRMFYSTNGGIAGSGTYPPDGSPNIATVAATPATYNWTVPDVIGTNLRVRIMDDDNALVAVESANTFAVRGKLILDTPLNGTTQRVDDNVAIKWTPKGTMATVKLEYSTDNFTLAGNIFPVLGPLGESAAALSAGVNNVQQTFTWKIPDNISNSVRVRVINNADANVKGTSTTDFKIVGWFDITDPVGGVGVFKKVDDPFSVTWVRHGSIAQAKVEYSTNGFQDELANVLIGTVNSPAQSVSWPIPDAIGANVKVRISDPLYNGTTVFTQPSSSAALEIRGQIKLNAARVAPGPDSPVGGEIWLIGTDHLVQWEKHGTIGNVKVEYKVGAGAYSYIADAAATQATSVAGDTFNWRIPNQKGLDNVIMKVTATGDSNVTVVSNTFTIRAGFSWTNPSAAGQVFNQGSTPTLTWATNGTVPTIDLKYSTNGDSVYDGDADPNYVFMKDTLGNNADNINNSNTFNWPVPTNINASKDVYFVVVDSADPDAKNVTAKVKIAGVLAMDEPDNNPTVERWGVTTNQTIAWTMTGNVGNVKIEYTKDVTAPTPVWEVPAISTSVVGSTLSYTWTNIPLAAVSSKAAVRVSDVITDSGTTPAVSPLFKITGTFTPTAPTVGNVWYTTGTQGALVNPTRNITWATQGVIPTADLYYSTTGNSPGAWTLINTGAPIVDGGAGGSFAWTVPQVFSENMVIRIQDHDDALTFVDTSVFTVRGHINLTSPVGGELWGVNEAQSITWDNVGVVGTPNEVYIYYKKSAGGAWIQLQRPTLEYNIPNSGSFSWTPPESELSTTAYVKIENILAPTDAKYVSTQSPAPFKLMRRYQLIDPDGGEVYVAGQAKDITWNKWGTPVGDVRIDLDLDGSNAFATNISLTTPNDGVYSWTPLASQVAPAAKIRIRDVGDTTNEKPYISGSPFVIRATLIMDAMPATVNIGDVYDILWTRQGNIPNAKLVYTTTGNFALDSRPIEDLNGTPMAGGLVPNQDTITNNPTRGRHRWKIPDLILSERANLQLRLVDPNDDPGSENISTAFRVLPKFTVITPNGNVDPQLTDKLKVGVPYNITWTSTSSSAVDKTPSVTILYSTNGGGTYPFTITTTANDGSYTWTVPATGGVPDDISDQVKVKVVSATVAEATALAQDATDENIKIISNFTLTAPNGGATYDVGDPFTITWTKIGTANNVSLMYSTNGGSSFTNTIEATTSNDLSEAWTGGIPNAIGTQVRVRVKSTTDDGEDISDADFRIRGKLAITAPTTGTPVPIGQTYRIQWTTNGTIPNVNIVYDTQDGTGGYPNTIATNIPNVGFYDWLNVPDNGTPDARIRVIDARVAESDVIGTSNKFNIVGNFTMLTPTNGQDLIVNSNYNVTWHWGGTIRFVKVSYTTNSLLAENVPWTNITTIDYGAASGDGANGTATRTYVWAVPDDIAPNVRFKVENANDSSVYDVSTGSFRIKGGYTFQSPVGGERWVTNEVRNVTWLTDGTVPFVNLEYSFDNFATAGVTFATNVANNGSGLTTTYAWAIPDPGIANVPKSTKIRVVNAADPTNYQVLGAAFNIDYYNITWEIRDLVTNASLSQLTVNEVKASDPNFTQWSEAGISTNPPRLQKTPYGTWVATWTKAGFGDGVQVVVANSDQSILLYMETSTVHIWLADSRVSYDPDADVLTAAGWLSRDGSITTGAILAVFKIYDGATLLYTLNDNTVDPAGFFNWTVPAPTGFVAGKTYTTICEVTVGSGGVFKTPSSFQITDAAKLEEVKDTVNSVLDVPISVVQANIQTTLDAQTTTLTTKLDQQTQTIQTVLTNFENTISSSIVSLESAANQSLVSAQTLEDTALKFSWKAVVAPNPALTGDIILLQAQGPRSLFPYLSVYNNKNKQVIANGLMTEDQSRPGNYSYAFPAAAGDFAAGEAYTYVVTEDITGGLVAGSGFIEAISLTSVAGLAAAAPAAEKAAKEAALAIEKLRTEMAKGGNVEDAMKSLKRAIDDMRYASDNVPEKENKIMRDRVAEIMDQVKTLAGDSGLNLDEIFTKAIEESSTVQEIRSRTGQINQAVDLIGAVVEKRLGGVEEPIVDIQLEPVS